MIRPRRREYVVSALLVIAIAALLALQELGPWQEAAPPDPWPVGEPGAVSIGVTTLALARNSYDAWDTADLAEVDDFEQRARLHADVVMWFADWAHASFDAAQARAIADRGATPEITWEPWDSSVPQRRPQPAYTLRSIARGAHDATVRRFAAAVAEYGDPLRLRFAHEMNGDWYPWAEGVNGNAPGEYVRAWRHVHRIFGAAGATNVTWIWSPVTGDVRASQYPGDAYVDVVGLSGLVGSRHWRSFAEAFVPSLRRLHRLAPDKPVALTEIGVSEEGGDKPAWIRAMFAGVRDRPYVDAVSWFQLRKEMDWRIESSPASQAAFAAGAALARERPVSPGAR